MTESVDCVVVGAGWFGLAAAKVYLEFHPADNLVVLECSGSCGGTWAENRIYPGLKTNNIYGTFQYPDFPMRSEVYGVQPGQHVPGAVVHRYLTDFAKRYGIFSRTRFHTKLESVASAESDTWNLTTRSTSGSQETNQIHTKRLVLATGLTSTPNLPTYPGREIFKGKFFHARDFCVNGETTKTVENVVVVGGAKSAVDVAYAYADAGAQVDMIIRPTGKGPGWLAQPYVDFGMRLEKLLFVRALTCFSPCPFGAEAGYGGWRAFLHGTTVGRFIVDNFWKNLGGGVLAQNNYASHPELKKFQPWESAFWAGSNLSIHNYERNFFDMIRNGKVRVHIADVDHLSEEAVHLTDNTTIKADIVVCCTGWKKESPIKFIDVTSTENLELGLGLTQVEQMKLNAQTDQAIFDKYPKLKEQPPTGNKSGEEGHSTDPLRLYRFIVPPKWVSKRNIVYAGMVSTVNTAVCANTQALWISAFFDDKLDRIASTQEEITKEVMLHTQWNKWRHPCGFGTELPDMVFDALPYVDMLVNDLGCRVNRKSNFFWELFSPYMPEDFAGLIDEWAEKHPAS